MGTFRGLPPEVLETLGLEPDGEEDEPDEPSGPYEPRHPTAEVSPPTGVAGWDEDPPGGPASPVTRAAGAAAMRGRAPSNCAARRLRVRQRGGGEG
jgi:hypothetical protein